MNTIHFSYSISRFYSFQDFIKVAEKSKLLHINEEFQKYLKMVLEESYIDKPLKEEGLCSWYLPKYLETAPNPPLFPPHQLPQFDIYTFDLADIHSKGPGESK